MQELGLLTEIDWDNLTFSHTPTKSMYVAHCDEGKEWEAGNIVPFGNISISPVAGVLNYGQGIFEGMKAYRTCKDRIVLFRPEKNADRANQSAKRICIPPVPVDMFLDAIISIVQDNEDYIPPLGKGSLYIRPLIWGTGPVLGVKPAPSYTFLIFVSPVGPYFKSGVKCLNLFITNRYHRAAPKGVGGSKVIGNYAAALYPSQLAQSKGFDEVIYLNAGSEQFVEEVGSANLFVLKDNILSTAPLTGSILPGVTRDSVMKIAREILNMEVVETNIPVEDVFDADEVFCTGTAVVVTPIGKITTYDSSIILNDNEIGPVTQELNNILTGIQNETREDSFDWLYPIW